MGTTKRESDALAAGDHYFEVERQHRIADSQRDVDREVKEQLKRMSHNARDAHVRQTKADIEQAVYSMKAHENEAAQATPESRRIIEAAQAIQQAQYKQYGRRIALSAAVRRVKRERPELIEAARPRA